MTPEERDLITGLFERLKKADTAQRDRDAEQLIQTQVGQQPSAPYLLAQTVLVQEHALNNAQARIAQLERQVAEASSNNQGQNQGGNSGGGSFLSGLFGGGGNRSTSNPPNAGNAYQQQPPPMPASNAPNYPSTMNMPQSAGGGFLRTALAAAAGVAGGSLLMNGFQNLLGHNAGPFASSLGGVGGGLGSGFLGGGSEIVENREVINNYYNNDSGSGQNSGGDGLFGGSSGFGFGEASSQPDQPGTIGSSFFGNSDSGSGNVQETGYDTPPTDDDATDDGYDTPPTDDDADFDNSSDFDGGGDDSGGSDDGGGLA